MRPCVCGAGQKECVNKDAPRVKKAKQKRSEVKHQKWRAELAKQEADKKAGRIYATGVATLGDVAVADKDHTNGPKRRSVGCRCGSSSHQRTSHSDCPMNKKNKAVVACTEPASNPPVAESVMTATTPEAKPAQPKTDIQLTLDWDILDPNLPGDSSDDGEDDDLMPGSAKQDKK